MPNYLKTYSGLSRNSNHTTVKAIHYPFHTNIHCLTTLVDPQQPRYGDFSSLGLRSQLKKKLGLKSIQWLQQKNSTQIIQAGSTENLSADGSYTQEAHVACAIYSADCVPVLLYNPYTKITAALHVGWRGLVNGLLEQFMCKYGENPSAFHVMIGPCIHTNNFEVKQDFVQLIHQQKPHMRRYLKHDHNRFYFDLRGAVQGVLSEYGVCFFNDIDLCTYQSTDFFSYRRLGQKLCQATLIWQR